MHANFHRRVSAGTILPRPNRFDGIRAASDAKMFPNYHQEISFAALSLDGQGSRYYGSVFLELKEVAVDERATVFEGNSLLYLDPLPQETPVPFGLRAVWSRRDELAAAKLEPRIHSGCCVGDYGEILLSQDESDAADFVEVHIYGPVHRDAVNRVTVVARSTATSPPHWENFRAMIKDLCTGNGIPFKEVS